MALKFSWSMIYHKELKSIGRMRSLLVIFFLTFVAECFIIFVPTVPKPALERAALRCPAGRRKKQWVTMSTSGTSTEKIQQTDAKVRQRFKVFGKMRWMLLQGIGIFC